MNMNNPSRERAARSERKKTRRLLPIRGKKPDRRKRSLAIEESEKIISQYIFQIIQIIE